MSKGFGPFLFTEWVGFKNNKFPARPERTFPSPASKRFTTNSMKSVSTLKQRCLANSSKERF